MKHAAALATVAALALTPLIAPVTAVAAAKPKVPVFPSCADLNARYRHGVARKGAHDHVKGRTKPVTTFVVDDKVYAANARLDRDKDGVACEKR